MNQNSSRHHRSFCLVLMLCVGVFSSVDASAELSRRDGGHIERVARNFGPHLMFKLLHKLDVTDEQRAAIGEVMDKHRPVMRKFMADMMDGKKALHDILTSSDYDQTQIVALAITQAKNAEKMFLATARTFADISALLTPEQRRQLAELIEKRGKRWEKHHDQHWNRDRSQST